MSAITRVELTRMGGEAERALRGDGGARSRREAAWLRIFDGEGRSGIGEVAPLPGYSPDSLEACVQAIEHLCLAGTPIPSAIATESASASSSAARSPFNEEAFGQLDVLVARLGEHLPAARFGLETALLDLIGQRLGAPLHALLSPATPPALPVSTLLPDGIEAEVVAAARRAVDLGARCLKLKIGGLDERGDDALPRQLRAATAVRAAVGVAIALRLDANGGLPLERARAILAALAPLAPELVEEPVPPQAIHRLRDPPVPLALDESLIDPSGRAKLLDLAAAGGYRALVLKPVTLGGARACQRLARAAWSRGLDVLVSHTWDGPVGLTAAAHLSLALSAERPVRVRLPGLDRHAALAAFPPLALAWLDGGRVRATGAPGLGLAGLT